MLRPGIRRQLDEELVILKSTAAFFHDPQTRDPLKDLRFLEIFDDLRERMAHEVDLVSEQRFLDKELKERVDQRSSDLMVRGPDQERSPHEGGF